MSATKTKSRKRRDNRAADNGAWAPIEPADVLTLPEAAAYLRVSEDDVLHMVQTQALRGRNFVDQWRFQKSALQDWLRTPAHESGIEALVALAGVRKDDRDVEVIGREAEIGRASR